MSQTKVKHPSIPIVACKSSNIEGYGYDQSLKKLAVRFKGGATYHYDGVEQATFAELQKAESVGKFFGAQIKDKFKFVRLGG
jgi:hypothetical protein